MTEEMRNKRDELAKDYGTSRFPVQNIETRKDFTQDINFARRMIHTEAFQAGFDACYTLMEAENAELKSRIEKLISALNFYADKNNWYDSNAKYTEHKEMPILYMVIASIDTEGETWIGGRTARAALKADEEGA